MIWEEKGDGKERRREKERRGEGGEEGGGKKKEGGGREKQGGEIGKREEEEERGRRKEVVDDTKSTLTIWAPHLHHSQERIRIVFKKLLKRSSPHSGSANGKHPYYLQLLDYFLKI